MSCVSALHCIALKSSTVQCVCVTYLIASVVSHHRIVVVHIIVVTCASKHVHYVTCTTVDLDGADCMWNFEYDAIKEIT